MIISRGDLFLQMTRVLRMRVGDACVLFDGDGSETVYRIDSIGRESLSLRWVERRFPQTESKKKIHLYQALPNKYEKIEYILQKWVEVGIWEFHFFRSDRSQKLAITEAKKARFQTIVQEAVEQCGGLMIPEIHWIDQIDVRRSGRYKMVLHTDGQMNRITDFTQESSIDLYVGPEGGWSVEELSKMRDNGFIFAHFSERVLRTETAGIVTSFALLNA